MNLTDRLKAALDAHPANQDLRMVAGGWSEARKRFVEDKSAANRKDWKTFEKDLIEILDSLEATAQPDPQPGWRWCEEAKAWPDPLPNRNQAYEYMRAMGWDVKRATWYLKCKTEYPPNSVDGWNQASLNMYANVHAAPRANSPAARWTSPEAKPSKAQRLGLDQSDQIANLTEALKEERRKGLALDNALKTLKLDIEQGKFVPSAELHEKQFGLAVIMYERIKEELSARVPTVIRAASGDLSLHAPVEQELRDTLDRGVRAAVAQESWTMLLENMRN